jgi:hypothetical protein
MLSRPSYTSAPIGAIVMGIASILNMCIDLRLKSLRLDEMSKLFPD